MNDAHLLQLLQRIDPTIVRVPPRGYTITIRNLRDIQGRSGNWNYDPYMHGMFNGLELALSVAEDREPDFRNAPPVWLCDRANEPSLFKRFMSYAMGER